MDIRECNDDPAYFSATNPNFKPNSPEDKPPIKYKGWFYGYTNSVHGKNFICLSVQGHASILKDMIFKFMREFNSDSILIDRAETVLHDKFGQYDFWQTRRSMQFSRKLYDYAVEFQKQNGLLGQNKDKATVPYLGEKWIQKIRKPSSPIGHDFIAAHIRRRDFIRMQEYRNIPSIKSAMDFLIQSAIDRSIYNIFIATDGNEAEITEMHHVIEDHNLDQPEIRKLKLVMFRPSHDEINQNQLYKGSIAIIDQIICSHASYFVGTEESTFSFRIHDEREILGFDENTTFNHFCSDGKTECGKPTHWEIIYNIKDEMY